MAATNPVGIGPLGVTAWFIAVLAGISCLVAAVAYLAEGHFRDRVVARQQITNSWRRGLFVGGYLTTILALTSLKQFNVRDAILLALLLILAEFYVVARA
jgi:hypothetical protein